MSRLWTCQDDVYGKFYGRGYGKLEKGIGCYPLVAAELNVPGSLYLANFKFFFHLSLPNKSHF